MQVWTNEYKEGGRERDRKKAVKGDMEVEGAYCE